MSTTTVSQRHTLPIPGDFGDQLNLIPVAGGLNVQSLSILLRIPYEDAYQNVSSSTGPSFNYLFVVIVLVVSDVFDIVGVPARNISPLSE